MTGKKEGENLVDITTTIDLLPVFWEAEKVTSSLICTHVSVTSEVLLSSFVFYQGGKICAAAATGRS